MNVLDLFVKRPVGPAPAIVCRSILHKLSAGRVSSISTLHVGPDQPNPGLTQTVFWWRFPNNRRAAELPALTINNKTRTLHKVYAGRPCT